MNLLLMSFSHALGQHSVTLAKNILSRACSALGSTDANPHTCTV